MNDIELLERIDSFCLKRSDFIYNKLSYEEKIYFDNRYIDSSNKAETIYRLRNNIEIRPVCKECGKPVEFCRNGYFRDYCSIKCAVNSETTKQKNKETCIKKYGVEFANQSDIIKEKQKLGIYSMSEEAKKNWKLNIKKTHLNKTEIEKNEIKEKTKKTCLERYGVENPGSCEFIIEKIKNTNLLRYGVTASAKRQEVKDKMKETNIKRYGGVAPACSDKVKKKIKETNIKRYGGVAPSCSELVREKSKETSIKHYGVDIASKTEEVKLKQKQTCLKRYGVDTFFKTNKLKEKSNCKETKLKEYETKRKNNTFTKSKLEDKLYSLLCEKFGEDDIIRQYSSDKYPYNCDFYIKSKDLYIEYNGSHYHCGHPFDNTNKDDLFLLEQLKDKANNSKRHAESKKSQYDVMIYVWTELDPRKRQTAKNNNLNYIEIWKLNEVENYF